MSDNHDDRNRLFHVDSRRIQSQDDDQSQPYRWTILQALDGITSSYFGILIAVIVVGLVHFREPILEWLQSYRDRARGRTLWEILQRIAAWFPSPVPDQGAYKKSRNARRNRHRRQTSMPELENTVTNEKVSSYYQKELEPAFQQEAEYPEGWLVYHRILGVVKKTEADHFEISGGKGGDVLEHSDDGKPPGDGKLEVTSFENSNINEDHHDNVERKRRGSDGEKWDELKAMEVSEGLQGDDESNVLAQNGVVNLLKETALTAS